MYISFSLFRIVRRMGNRCFDLEVDSMHFGPGFKILLRVIEHLALTLEA